jgi:hypothetical protein
MFSLRRIGARSDLTQAYRTIADLNQAPPQYFVYNKKLEWGRQWSWFGSEVTPRVCPPQSM